MTRTLVLLAALAAAAPSGVAAQELPLDPVRAVVGAGTKLTWVAEQGSWLIGGKAGLVFQERLVLSAAGYALATSVEVGGTSSGTSFRLDMGYGGVLVEYLLRRDEVLDLTLASLVGAGYGEVYSPVQQIQITSDNFMVLEPEVFLRYRVLPWARLYASGGYRLTWGVSLPGVAPGDLEGLAIGLGIQVGF